MEPTQNKTSQILIIGAGAAGMISAIAAKKQNPACNVTILEKNPRCGKKLLATGNGRCNIGNSQASPADYFNYLGKNPVFVKPALEKFSPQNNQSFFAQLGLLIKEEEQGKLYPYSNQAATVVDILRLALNNLSIKLLPDFEVCRIEPLPKGFRLWSSNNQPTITGTTVIVACGGLASPQLSNSQGFSKLMESLGHKTTKVYPALVQVKTTNNITKALKGIKIQAGVKLYTNNKLVATNQGEVLFTEYGLSGPPIFQLSACISQNFNLNQGKCQSISLDLMPEYDQNQILTLLLNCKSAGNSTLENFLLGILNKRLGQQVLKQAGLVPLSRSSQSLTHQELTHLSQLLKALTFEVSGTTGWQNAQVMAGGLITEDFNPQTMESLLQPGVFACGEVLDVYGSCGGYNLHWAWSSGRLAGENAARRQNNA